MIRLLVNDFSCIKNADFTVGKYNVLIGPQASGKSVLCKLLYFFVESVIQSHELVLEQKSTEEFADSIRHKFAHWFPKSAWGEKKFSIHFDMGDFSIKVSRTGQKGSVNDNLRIILSKPLKNHLMNLEANYAKSLKALQTDKKKAMPEFQFKIEFFVWSKKLLNEVLAEDQIIYQRFVPAGRSFFTNLGRAFMAFDQGRVLDPITLEFGRIYTSLLEENSNSKFKRPAKELELEFSDILGGSITWEDERPKLQTPDGRVIPFSALSSGQQELLPLAVILRRMVESQKSWRMPRSGIFYIEEPEAHLFPSAQSDVIERLVSITGEDRQAQRLILTTHSPYVLSKLNNLAKAGLLSTQLHGSSRNALDKIVSKKSQIKPGELKAFAIIDGEMKNLVGDDGLIDGEYLDEISNRIGSEFAKLLDLEFEADAAQEMRSRDD